MKGPYVGYTHYITFNMPKAAKEAAKAEEAYQKALADCSNIAVQWNSELPKGHPHRLSGFTAHAKPGKYGGLCINGTKANAHEAFELRERFGLQRGTFCKTARKPYDTVVVACLAVLAEKLGEAVTITSDGDVSDWECGVRYACEVLGRPIPNPIIVTKYGSRAAKAVAPTMHVDFSRVETEMMIKYIKSSHVKQPSTDYQGELVLCVIIGGGKGK